MKCNILFESIGRAAFYFRYYDENNYYVIKLNVKGQKKMELYKKNEFDCIKTTKKKTNW